MEKFSHPLFYQGGDSQDSSHDDNNHDETDHIDISKVKPKFLRTFNSHSKSKSGTVKEDHHII